MGAAEVEEAMAGKQLNVNELLYGLLEVFSVAFVVNYSFNLL